MSDGLMLGSDDGIVGTVVAIMPPSFSQRFISGGFCVGDRAALPTGLSKAFITKYPPQLAISAIIINLHRTANNDDGGVASKVAFIAGLSPGEK
ncbi:hypothetical protein [uncultured Nevskia sp.]|uniref:hypothetical protein n=1 Tax=uncultured Nevskia sp. TaxID=228950 RepID=UPI0025D966DA|nr:hypothetical protein [uncultured Nevskia sp.]